MRRHRALRSLSVDHQHGLAHAARLIKAEQGDLDTVETARAFLAFWMAEVRMHFREEEEILLPIVARFAASVFQETPVGEMLLQHATLRGNVLAISDSLSGAGPGPELLGLTGKLLEEHIRLEERVIFPAIQDLMPEDALQRLEQAIASDRSDTEQSTASHCSAAPPPSRDPSDV